MKIDWSPLDAALERRTPVLWWRDDDVTEPSPALDRLLALAASVNAPLTLAAIPANTKTTLAERLEAEPTVAVAVHGWEHRNHAPTGEKTAEFGLHRPLRERMAEAERGLTVIRNLFGDKALAAFVPPWNRIAPDMPETLADMGYHGLSVYGEREPRTTPLPRFDAHLDPVDWRGTRSAVDPAAFVARTCELVATGAPIGLMTHHLAHDEAVWDLVEATVARLTNRGAQWTSLAALIQPRHP